LRKEKKPLFFLFFFFKFPYFVQFNMALSISEFEIVLDEDSPSITIDPLKRKKSKSGSTKTSPQKKPRITTGVSNQESDFGNFDDGFFGSPSPATASQHDLGLNHYVSLISSSIVPLEENVWCIPGYIMSSGQLTVSRFFLFFF